VAGPSQPGLDATEWSAALDGHRDATDHAEPARPSPWTLA
jgi:hypothetical protein